jgi:hypothetical protein
VAAPRGPGFPSNFVIVPERQGAMTANKIPQRTLGNTILARTTSVRIHSHERSLSGHLTTSSPTAKATSAFPPVGFSLQGAVKEPSWNLGIQRRHCTHRPRPPRFRASARAPVALPGFRLAQVSTPPPPSPSLVYSYRREIVLKQPTLHELGCSDVEIGHAMKVRRYER